MYCKGYYSKGLLSRMYMRWLGSENYMGNNFQIRLETVLGTQLSEEKRENIFTTASAVSL